MPGQAQGFEQQTGNPAIARRDRMVRRLQRRVERDAHAAAPLTRRPRSRLRPEAEQRRQSVDAAPHVEVAAHARLAGGGEPGAADRIADQRGERGGQSARIAGRHENAGRAVLDQLGNSRQPGRDAGETLALRLHQHVRQPVAVAVAADLGGEHEQIGLAVGGEHVRLRPRAAPFDAAGDPEPRAPARFSRSASAPPPIWTKRQARPGGSSASACQQIVIALFRDRATDRQDDDRPRRIAAIVVAAARPRRRKTVEIEPVIGEADHFRRRRQRGQMIAAVAGAGHGPCRRGKLATLLPFGNGPDVLGVRRNRPGKPAHDRGIARDRGRSVQKMRVQMTDFGRQFGREDQRLAPAPDAVRRRIADKIGEPRTTRDAIARQPAGRAASRRGPGAARLSNIRAGRAPAPGSSSCSGWRARSVGCRSDTIEMPRPRCSSASIS